CLDGHGSPTGQSRALSTGPQRLGCRVTRRPCPLTLVRVRLRPAVLAASESAVLFAERSYHCGRETNAYPPAPPKKSISSSLTRGASSWGTQGAALGRRSTRSRLGTSSCSGSARSEPR